MNTELQSSKIDFDCRTIVEDCTLRKQATSISELFNDCTARFPNFHMPSYSRKSYPSRTGHINISTLRLPYFFVPVWSIDKRSDFGTFLDMLKSWSEKIWRQWGEPSFTLLSYSQPYCPETETKFITVKWHAKCVTLQNTKCTVLIEFHIEIVVI